MGGESIELWDFPASPTFVAYGAELGVTRDYPEDFYRGNEMWRLERENRRLQEQLATCKRQVTFLPTDKPRRTSKEWMPYEHKQSDNSMSRQ